MPHWSQVPWICSAHDSTLPSLAFDVVVVVDVAGFRDLGPTGFAAIGGFEQAVVTEARFGVGEDEEDLGRLVARGLERVRGVRRGPGGIAPLSRDGGVGGHEPGR